jgi:hypothetical protein
MQHSCFNCTVGAATTSVVVTERCKTDNTGRPAFIVTLYSMRVFSRGMGRKRWTV